MVLDIHARPNTPPNPGTTTPGQVQYVRGGVARNVAECMSKLGSKPFIISVVGLDMAGDILLEHWKSSGLSTEGIQKCNDIATPVVSNIFDANGELAAAVASVEAVESFLTPEWILKFKCNICSAPVLMVDANMHPRSLEAVCQMAAESGIPIWFEPVSVTKSKRVASIAKFVTYTSPNEDELIAMANALSYGDKFRPIQRLDNNGDNLSIEYLFQMLKPAICLLLEKGIKMVVVTLGSHGVLLCSSERPDVINETKNTKYSSFLRKLYESCSVNQFGHAMKFKPAVSHPYVVHFPALLASVVGLTGAGDCFVGGTLASICAGLDVMQSMAVGVAVAKAAVETEANVPSKFCLTTVSDDAKQVFSAAKEVFNQ
ncbi:pfkB-like carbohydrate kinase family protein isoform X2 [Tasmannia lanceolata]